MEEATRTITQEQEEVSRLMAEVESLRSMKNIAESISSWTIVGNLEQRIQAHKQAARDIIDAL
jgi:hypothetical protein